MDNEPENLGTAEQTIDNRTLFRRLYLIILAGAGLLVFIYFLIEPLFVVWNNFESNDPVIQSDAGIQMALFFYVTVVTCFMAFPIGLIGCLVMTIMLLSAFPDRMKKGGGSIFWNILKTVVYGMGGGFLFLFCYIALFVIALICLIGFVNLFMNSPLAGFNAEFFGGLFSLFLVLFPLVSLLFIGRWTGIGILLYLNKISGKIQGTISKRTLSRIGWLAGAGYLLLLLSGRLIWQLLYHAPIFSWWLLHETQVIAVIFGISLFSAIAVFHSLSPENKTFLAEKLGDIE